MHRRKAYDWRETPADLDAITRTRLLADGIAALRRGDMAAARQLIEQIDDKGADAQFALAHACRGLNDHVASNAALDSVLAAQPGHIGALIMKGDVAAEHDPRAASAFYQATLANAARAQEQGPLDAPLIAEVGRIEAFLGRAAADHEAHLLDHLAAAGFAQTARAPRVQHAIDLLTGKREIFLQQPSAFYFSGLPQIEFYERDAFAWLPALEAAAPAMRFELEALMAEDGEFAPYVETPAGRPPPRNPLLDDPRWGACYLWKAGAPVERNATRLRLARRFADPQLAYGEALIFDDSIAHEAWNRGAETRVVQLSEIWRPEIADEERAALTALFEAIGDFGGEA